MARLPTRDDLGYGASGRSGRTIARYDVTGGIGMVNRSVQGLAGTIEQSGIEIAEAMLANQQELAAEEVMIARGQALSGISDFERSLDGDTDYGSYEDKFETQARLIWNDAAGNIHNGDARRKFISSFETQTLGTRNRVLEKGLDGFRSQRVVGLKDSLEGYTKRIADPDLSEEDRAQAKAEAIAAIQVGEFSGDLTPETAEEWRDAVLDGGNLVLGQRMIERDPNIITGKLSPAVADRSTIAMDFFQSKGFTEAQAAGIVGNLIHESGGLNPSAVGDGGTAHGIAQWRGERLTRLKRYANAQRKPWQDFQTQLEFITIELQDSETKANRKLKAATTVEEATKAFLGYERPRNYSENSPQNSHGYNSRLTYAGQAAGQTVKPDWFVNQSPENQLKLERLADARNREINTEQSRKLTAVQDALKGQYRLRIETPDPTLTRQDILNDPILDDNDKATLIAAYDEDQGDRVLVDAIRQGARINSFDSDQRRAGDKAFNELVRGATPEESASVAQHFTEQTGYIPSPIRNNLRNGAASNNPTELANAMATANYFAEAAPRHFLSMEGGEALRRDLDVYNAGLDLGYGPEKSAKRILDARDPEKVRNRDAILQSEPVKKTIEGVKERDIVSMFESFEIIDPFDILDRIQLGETEEAKLVAIEDYRDLLTDAIAETSGDMEQAKEVARERFMRTYSVSTMTLASRNGATIQKYVPEVAYPPVNGDHAYIRNQAFQALVEQEIDGILSGRIGLFAPEDVYLQPYEQTESDMEAGRPPRFQLHYEEDGRIHLYNLPFFALPEQPTFDFSANIKKRDINRMQEEYRQSVISGENPGSFIESTKKKSANLPTPKDNSADLQNSELREREERAFREGQKAFQGTEGPAWMKHKNQADTIERILEGLE